MRTITITAFRRPQYFEKMLKSLVRNDLQGWRIHLFVEPSPLQSEFKELAERIFGDRDWHMHLNPERLGVRRNPYQAQQYVFEHGSEVNLYLEEDLEVAPDTTRLAAWFADNNGAGDVGLNLIAGGCLSSGLVSYPECEEVLVEMPIFNSLGYVITAAQWKQHIQPHWFDFPFGMLSSTGGRLSDWDCAIYAYVMSRPELRVLQPICARARHIGREGGENCVAGFHDRAFADMHLCATELNTLNYRRCEDWMELPHPIRSHLSLWQEMAGHQRVGRKLARRLLFLLWPWYRFRAAFRSWRKMKSQGSGR